MEQRRLDLDVTEDESLGSAHPEPSDLLARAEDAYRGGDMQGARADYLALVELGHYSGWAYFALGRISRDEDAVDDALEHFARALEHEPTLFWANYEQASLQIADRRSVADLVTTISHLLDFEEFSLQPSHVEILERGAHIIWDYGNVELAVRLLERLWFAGDVKEFAVIRLVERSNDERIVSLALGKLKKSQPLHPLGARILAQHYQRQGLFEEALPFLEQHFLVSPEDFDTFMLLLHVRLKSACSNTLQAFLLHAATFNERQRSMVNLVVEIENGVPAAAGEMYVEYTRLYDEVPEDLGISLAYKLVSDSDLEVRSSLINLLFQAHPESAEVALLETYVALADHRWQDALDIFESRLNHIDPKGSSLRLAQIEVMAFNGMLDQAEALLAQETHDNIYDPIFLRCAFRILAERGRWDEVLQTGIQQIDAVDSFSEYFSYLVRAVREVGGARRLFDRLMQLPQPLTSAQQAAAEALIEDLSSIGDLDVLRKVDGFVLPPGRLRRIEAKLQLQAQCPAPVRDRCIFYCADGVFFLPALVSLTSLAMNNALLSQRFVFLLVVDQASVATARPWVKRIAEHLGLKIELVDAADVLVQQPTLRTDYGQFTGGHILSDAAYYRIFHARQLAGSGRFREALYIDSDTIVRPGLEDLFSIPMTQPLMARADRNSPAIRQASQLHCADGTYFNSGVLRLDLSHPDLPSLLDRTVDIVGDRNIQLIYHDQCAINRSFNGRVDALPDRFNFFIRDGGSTRSLPGEQPVIMHYLDRPKPWDSMYMAEADEWFAWLRVVGEIGRGLPPLHVS